MFSYLKYLLSNDYLLNIDNSIITPLYISKDFINSVPPVTIVPEDPDDLEQPEEPGGSETPEETPGETPEEPENPEGEPEGEPEDPTEEPEGEGNGESGTTTPPEGGNDPVVPEEPQVKTQYQLFAESIQELIEILYYTDKNMTIVSEVQYLNSEFNAINSTGDPNHSTEIKYIKLLFSDTQEYSLIFDVSSFADMDNINAQQDAYLVYLKFEKQL